MGRTLGEFVLQARIGEGSFGAVYRAIQPALERDAVVKVLHPWLRTKIARDRFLREARLASRLDHPYAAHIYAFGAEPDGALWIAMELVRGTPLDKLLEIQGPLAIERFVPLFDRICEVVHTAHEHGIVHRDLKPANVMVLARAGRLLPKLLDFGIAQDVAALPAEPRQDSVCGTPLYMAPELWLDPGSAGPASDVYALGVLAYEAITGAPPFTGANVPVIAHAHMTAWPPPIGPQLPAALDQVLATALAKQPERRFPDALALAAACRRAAGAASDPVALPALDPARRDAATRSAPQPIAEAIAAIDAAHHAHQARDAILRAARTITRYLGLLALATRSRFAPATGPARAADAAEAVRSLHRRALTDREWLELTRALTRDWTDRRDAYPIPELIEVFHGARSTRAGDAPEAGLVEDLAALVALRDTAAGDDATTEWLERALGHLARSLDAVAFLGDYALAVTLCDGGAEPWMGAGRSPRARVAVRGKPLPPGLVVLLDQEGVPILALDPLVQVAEPTPGGPPELFLFDGRDARGARLVSLPRGFAHHDDRVWAWFRSELDGSLDDGGRAADDDQAPYRGLAAFSTADHAMFFGREKLVDSVTNRLRVQPLIAIVGHSGAGKSSFVQAGVIPALPSGWRAITMRPGPAPLGALLARLEAEGVAVAELHDAAERDRASVGALIRADAAARGPLLVVVDQLEEIFTLCHDPDERARFGEVLAGVARFADDPVRVIVTLRDDFLLRAEQLPALRDRIGQGLQLLTVPGTDDLLRIVIEPARRAGYELEDAALPVEMVEAVAHQPGALALISYTAAKLWELRDRHFKQLTRSAYDALGGVGGALARHAEATLEGLPAEQRGLTREAFRHLVTSQNTRAVLERAELRQLLGDDARADRVIEQLVAARLLVAADHAAGRETIEIVHEALLLAWPRLIEWRREDAEGARFHEQLRSAARQWHDRGRPRGLLWRGDAAADYVRWRAKHAVRLAEVEAAFAGASVAETTRGRRIRGATIAAVIASLGLAVTVLVGTTQREREARGRAEALSQELEANIVDQFRNQGRRELLAGDAAKASVYLGEALRRGADDPGLRYLVARALPPLAAEVARLTGHAREIEWLELSPDGRALVTASGDGTARVWDMATGRATAVLDRARDKVSIARFDPRGERVAVASYDHTLTIYRRTGDPLVTITHANYVQSVAFAPAGDRIVTTASEDPVAHVWSAATGAGLLALRHDRPAKSAVFDPRGARIATTSLDATIRIWDAATGELRDQLAGHRDRVVCIAYSPGGDVLVSGSEDKTARLWDVASHRPLAVLEGHGAVVTEVAFSPDGRHVATASEDGTARVWHVPDGELEVALLGHTGAIRTIAFDHAGERIVTASRDGTARIWDARTGAVLASLQGHVEPVKGAVFSPDGTRVVTASQDATARIWDASRSRLRAILPVHGLAGAAFTAAGSRLVAWTDGGSVTLADAGGHPLRVLEPGGGPIVGVAATADGRRAVIASRERPPAIWDLEAGRAVVTLGERPAHRVAIGAGGTALTVDGASAQLWDAATGRALAALAHAGAIDAAGFSPRGDRVFTGSRDKTGRLWDARDGRLLATLGGHQSWVWRFAFTADGARLVTASPDGTARIWAAATGHLLRELRGRSGPINAVAFDPAGRRVVTGSQDATATIWDADTGARLGSLGRHGHVIMAVAFSPDGAFVATASMDGTARIWDAARFEQIDAMDVTWPHRTSDTNLAWIEFGATADTALVASRSGALVWATDRETRDGGTVERWISDHAPYRLSRASLVRVHSD